MKSFSSTLSMSKGDAASLITRFATQHSLEITVLNTSGWLFPTTAFSVRGEDDNIASFQKSLYAEMQYRAQRQQENENAYEAKQVQKAKSWLANSNPLTRLAVRHEWVLLVFMLVGVLASLIGGAATLVVLTGVFTHELPPIALYEVTLFFLCGVFLLRQGLKAMGAPKEHVLAILTGYLETERS